MHAIYQKPDSFWEDKITTLGFTGLGTVVDVGAGPGHYSLALARFNQRVLAVEPLPEYRTSFVQRLEEGNADNVEVLPNRAEDMGTIHTESADGVFCNNVLQYTDAAEVMDEIHRVSRKGATLFVSVPGLGVRLSGLSEAVKTGDFGAFNRHFRATWNTFWTCYVAGSNRSAFYFTHRRLRKLLSRHGFEVVSLFPYSYHWEDEPARLAGFPYYFGVLARRPA